VQRFPGGLVFKAHKLWYHSTLGLRAIKKRRRWIWLLIRNIAPLGSYSRTMPRALWVLYGGLLFLMSEVPL